MDDLLSKSDQICSLTDDLVSFLDAPQDPYELKKVFEEIALIVAHFQDLFVNAQGKDALWRETFRKQFEQSLSGLKSILAVRIQSF